MKISDIDDKIQFVDLENFFDVYEDKALYGDPFAYNLNSTVYFDGIPQLDYNLKHDMFWTTLSYEIYQTTRLWWLLMKVNKVDADSIFESVRAGSTIKYIDKDVVRDIIMDISNAD